MTPLFVATNAVRVPHIAFALSAAPSAAPANQHFFSAPLGEAVRVIVDKTGRHPAELWAQSAGDDGVLLYGGRPGGYVRIVARITDGLTASQVNIVLAAMSGRPTAPEAA